ncbi:hypothetical protein QFC22_003504 [Naganishia vaughanmartiniae]|uniref:Uncharacterized protein n=1 Tax=Naganishia vaughanmartiniae TaxID=1424756 RepID=A0ACC2X5Z5_9TREE|nr:hypothetical protein QFC22_003504 [Naganishia vaughanmartiniae]
MIPPSTTDGTSRQLPSSIDQSKSTSVTRRPFTLLLPRSDQPSIASDTLEPLVNQKTVKGKIDPLRTVRVGRVKKAKPRPRSGKGRARSSSHTSELVPPSTTGFDASNAPNDGKSTSSSHQSDLRSLFQTTYNNSLVVQEAMNIVPPSSSKQGWRKDFMVEVCQEGAYKRPTTEPQVVLCWRVIARIDHTTVRRDSSDLNEAGPVTCPRFKMEVFPVVLSWDKRIKGNNIPDFHFLDSKAFSVRCVTGQPANRLLSSVLNNNNRNVVPFKKWAEQFCPADGLKAAQEYVEEQAAGVYEEYVEEYRIYSKAYDQAQSQIRDDAAKRREELMAAAKKKKEQGGV